MVKKSDHDPAHPMKDQRHFWHNPQLKVNVMQAIHVDYAYPPHSHNHYVISLIERGLQTFTHQRTKYTTPPRGLILINPGVVHTGEPATERGFQIRSIYPTTAHLQSVMAEYTHGRYGTIPHFSHIRVDDLTMAANVLALHQAITNGASALECESRFIDTLTQLINHYADMRPNNTPLGNERYAVKRVRHYIEERFAKPISLSDLAAYVSLSPYHLLRVFRAEVGVPPHTYLQDIRIQRAQRLIESGFPLVDVALSVGFNSQSHLTRRFKRTVGITPGQYAEQIQPNRRCRL